MPSHLSSDGYTHQIEEDKWVVTESTAIPDNTKLHHQPLEHLIWTRAQYDEMMNLAKLTPKQQEQEARRIALGEQGVSDARGRTFRNA